jgi:putative membrane protein
MKRFKMLSARTLAIPSLWPSEGGMKAVLRYASALCMFSISNLGYAGSLPTGFRVGYNEAWIENNYGNWLTSNPLFNLSSAFPSPFICCQNNSPLSAMLLGMAQGNAKVIRVFLFPAVQGIRIDTTVTSLTSSKLMTIGLTTDFTSNLASLLQWMRSYNQANNTDIKMYFTALNGADMNVVTSSNNPTLHLYYQRLISNSYEIYAYETLALAPILNTLSSFQDVVYGFDLINEIEGAINAGYFSNNWNGARTWLANMAYAATASFPWLPVTSTAGYGWAVQELTLGYFSGLRLNFYDVHIYSDSGTYSGQTALCNKVKADRLPIILGEFGQRSSSVSDSIQNTATTKFLQGARGSCFSGALGWKYEGTSGEPWYSYLYVTGNSLSTTQCTVSQQLPGPACPRPAYTTIKNFNPSLVAQTLTPAAGPELAAEGGTSAVPQNTTRLTDAEIAHLMQLARQIDVTTAKLALDKSSNPQVRAFARATLDDYTAADRAALSSLASANVNPQDNAVSQSLNEAESERAQRLSQLSGAAFDEAYAQNELAYHVFIIGALEITLIPSAKHPQVETLLRGELARYEKHLVEARALVNQLRISSPTLPLPPPKQHE